MTYNRFINCSTLSIFNTSLESGSITDSDLVFIEETKQIWTHGTFYSCSYTKDEIDNLVGSVLTKANIEKVLTGNITSHTHNQYLTSYTETDPTVPSWAKSASKPTYTASEVGALSAGGTAVNASKVANSLTLKLNSGTTEGTNLYTFNGSASKTLDIKAGSNITLSAGAGSLTISSSYTNTTYNAGSGLSLSGTTFSHASSINAGTVSDGGSNRTLGWGGTFRIPSVTYNATGHITGVGLITLTMPANPDTNTTYSFANGSNGSFTVTPSGGSAQTVSIGKPSTAGTADIARGVDNSVTGTNQVNLVYATMADNDQFRIRVGGTSSNAGWVELATADDASEPIYVRQYTGVFTNLVRTATLLDGGGNTSFPGTVTAAGFSGPLTGNCTGNAGTATRLATARNIALSGSVTGSANFDGSGNITISTSTNHNHDGLYTRVVGRYGVDTSGTAPYNYIHLFRIANSIGYSTLSVEVDIRTRYHEGKLHITIPTGQYAYNGGSYIIAGTESVNGRYLKMYVKKTNQTSNYDYFDVYYYSGAWNSGSYDIVFKGYNGGLVFEPKGINVDNLPSGCSSINPVEMTICNSRDYGSNTVSTLSSLPVNKSLVKANLSSATNISLASNMNEGESMTIICSPTANFTQPLPNSGSWTSMDGSSLSVTSGKKFEINIYCIASGTYSISCKVAK